MRRDSLESGIRRYFFLFTFQTFRRLMASYAILFLLPLVVSFLIYAASVARIDKETEGANRASLALLKNTVDSRIEGLYIAADQISIYDKTRIVAQAVAPLSPFQRINMSDVQKLLVQTRQANTFIAGAYLYCPDSGYVLSDVSRYHKDEFSLVASGEFGMSLADWERMMKSGSYRTITPLPARGDSDNPRLLFTQKLYYTGFDKPAAIVAMLLDEGQLQRIIDAAKSDRRIHLAMSLPHGFWRSAGLSSIPADLDFSAIPKEYRKTQTRIGSIRYVLSSTASSVASLRYISLIPFDIYRSSVVFIGRIMTAYVLLSLLVGVTLSYIMARRSITPIRRLAARFLEKQPSPATAPSPKTRQAGAAIPEADADVDFGFLEEALGKLLKEQADLKQTLQKERETLRGSLLARLMRALPSQIPDILSNYASAGVELGLGRFAILAAAVDRPKLSSKGSQAPGNENAQAEDLVGFLARQVFEECFKGHYKTLAADYGGVTYCLVDIDREPAADPSWEGTMEDFVAVCDKIRALFAAKFDVGMSCAIGSIHESKTEIPSAIQEVDRILEFIHLFEKRDITVLADNLDAREPFPPSPGSYALHRLVAERVYQRDFSGAAAEVGRYLDFEQRQSCLTLAAARLRMSAVVNVVFEIISELRPTLSDDFFGELNPLYRLTQVQSIPELKHQIDLMFALLAERLGDIDSETKSGIKDEVIRYVEDNYQDINLCVGAIADHFTMSVPHLSRSFKREAHIGLLDFIHLVRVRKAKALLKERRLNVEEIAKAVGCGSRVTLARAFKRYEGMAPAAFKEFEESYASDAPEKG